MPPPFVAEPGVLPRFGLLDEFGVDQRLDGAVERARTEPHAAIGLFRDMPHDAVAVQVFTGQGQQDLEGSQRKRDELSFGHKHSIINISIIDYTPRLRNLQEGRFAVFVPMSSSLA